MTSDPTILDIALHCHLEFTQEIPKQMKLPFQRFSQKEEAIIEKEIEKLLKMEVISEVFSCEDQFISPIFLRPKKDGEYRMILNLKKLNKFIAYHHFKLDTFETALKLIKPNCYMASIDLRHAYYSVPIAKADRRYLRFIWKDKIFEFSALANGVACAPRFFTKLMKPIYARLRQMGHTNSGYIDDSLLIGDTEKECETNVHDTVFLMTNVEFLIHEQKSIFNPTQEIGFLGNIINSQKMVVFLPRDKVSLIIEDCRKLTDKKVASIREVAHVIGLLVSTFSAVEFGPLYYRELEKEKILALKRSKGDFEAKMSVTHAMQKDLRWWIDHLQSQERKIAHGNPSQVITTDASLSGWGGPSVLNRKLVVDGNYQKWDII